MRSCKFCDRNLENPLSCHFEGIGDKRKYINLYIFLLNCVLKYTQHSVILNFAPPPPI